MAYDSVNKVINAPVSIYDVQRCLAKSANDVGNLCVADNINKWSKFKPVSYPAFGVITDTILKSINYGLDIQSFSNYLDAYNNGIFYNPPTGGASSPYRLHDFDKYNHIAIAPFSKISNIVVSKLDKDTARIEFMYNIGGGDNQIGLSDLIGLPIGSKYLAVILNDGTNTFIKTSDITINDGATYIDLPIRSGFLQNYTGTLNAKFVICSLPFTELSFLSAAIGNTYYPLLVRIASDAMCNIEINNSINMVMMATKISSSPTSMYSNIETYITTPANPDASYFLSSGGKLYLHIVATNNSSDAVIVSDNFALKATPSLTGSTSGVVNCQLYDNAGTAVDTVSIPANTTGAFKIGLSNLLFMNNNNLSTPPEPIQIQTDIQAYYKGMRVNIAIDGPINISN